MAPAVDRERLAAKLRPTLAEFQVAHNTRDWFRLRAMLVDDFVFIDHRATSFGSGEGADDYVQLLRVAVDLVRDRQIAAIEAVPAGRPEIIHMRAAGTDEFGGAIEWDFFALWGMNGELLSRLEVFEVEQLDSAIARAGELSASA